MIQTGLIQNAHNDLVTDASYDFYGLRLATGSIDQRVKIWQLDEITGSWEVEDDWKAHDAAISRISWAHPEFGAIIASSSFDRTVKVWEQMFSLPQAEQQVNINVNGSVSHPVSASPSTSRWIERATLVDARGTVRAVEFAPRHFGLKLATISSDNHLRVYECLEQSSLSTWLLAEEVDVLTVPSTSSPSSHTLAFATPTQTNAVLDSASASQIAYALQQSQPPSTQSRPGVGNREADGGWCISWCKDRYWGEIIAAGAGISGVVKIIHLSPSGRSITLLALSSDLPSPPDAPTSGGVTVATPTTDSDVPAPHAITSVAWAPSCGRSYHLIATGGRDGHVRIWRVKPAEDIDDTDGEEGTDSKWTGTMVADFDHHRSAVTRVEWNITGTVLSSAGNDGRVRLWKATIGSVWRSAGSIGVEQTEEQQDNDIAMDENAATE